MKRHFVNFGIWIALTLLLLLCALYFLQGPAVFHPNDNPEQRELLVAQPNFETVKIISGKKTWNGMIRHANADAPSPLIIFFYGNYQNSARAMHGIHAAGLWPYFNDYSFLIMDYAGYGLNDGRPTEKNIYEMALAAYDYAAAFPDVSRIIVGGYSIGTGPAVYLAANREVDGLFLLSPYANGYDLYNSALPIFYGPLRLLVRYKFPSDAYAKAIDIPVLVVASRDDEVIPFRSTEQLHGALNEESIFVTLSDVPHNSVFSHQTTLDSIRAYLDGIGLLGQ